MENETETVTNDTPSFEEAAGQAIDAATESDPSPDTQESAPAQAQDAAPQAATPQEVQSWDTLPEWARKEYQTTGERYKNLQSRWSKDQSELKKYSERFPEFETKAKQLEYFNQLYEKNPEIQAVLNKYLGVKSDVDPSIQEDPLFKYLQGYQAQLDQKLQPIMKHYETLQTREREAHLDAQVDRVTNSATTEYKKVFGKDPTDQEMSQIYKHMVENKVYDGVSAVRSAFMEQAINAKVQAALSEQMAKKGKSARVSSVNSSQASAGKGAKSFEDIAASALEELGFN